VLKAVDMSLDSNDEDGVAAANEAFLGDGGYYSLQEGSTGPFEVKYPERESW